jgi:opacity protein-like surface antigen
MKKIALLSVLFASFLVPMSVKAADVEGFYVGATGAADFVQTDSNHHHQDSKFETGYFGAIDLGYRWCNGFHLEAEVAYRYNRHKKHHSGSDLVDFGSDHRRGHRDVWAGMVNGLYDFNLDSCTCWSIQPYLGIGLGYAHVKNHEGSNFDISGSGHRRGDDNQFAYQVIAGLAYPICDNVDLAVEYRFFQAVSDRRHSTDVFDHDIGVNVKYYF